MLKTPEKTVNVENLLTLADLLDQEPADFNFHLWSFCISGQCRKLFESEPRVALGLSDEQRNKLFKPERINGEQVVGIGPDIQFKPLQGITAKECAKVVRNLALTGEVDWGVTNIGKSQKELLDA